MATDTATTGTIYRSTSHSLTEAMRELLTSQAFVTLGSHNPDGSIHLVPTWYLFEDGRLNLATWSGSRKARNVSARPQVTVTVEDRDAAAWVSATGTAQLLTGAESVAVNRRLRQRYMTDEGLAAVGSLLDATEDATIAITPDRWKAWDFESTFLAAVVEAGIPLDGLDRWYRD
jgi:PPOX class probable F420-dependent enzyme